MMLSSVYVVSVRTKGSSVGRLFKYEAYSYQPEALQAAADARRTIGGEWEERQTTGHLIRAWSSENKTIRIDKLSLR